MLDTDPIILSYSELTYLPQEAKLIQKVRVRLGDNKPSLRYRFAEGLDSTTGQRWTDDEIFSCLEDATSDINSAPPHSSRQYRFSLELP